MDAAPELSARRVLALYPRRTGALVTLMTLAGLVEGFGLMSVIPLIEGMARSGGMTVAAGGLEARITAAVTGALRLFGIAPSLPALLVTIALALAAKGLFRWLAMVQVGAAVADVAAGLRLRLARALLAARWSGAADRSGSALVAAITRDAFWGAYAYRNACAALAAAVQLVIYAAAVLVVSWQLGLLALAIACAVTLPLGVWVRASRHAGGQQTRHSHGLARRLGDVLDALKPIKAMRREAGVLAPLQGEIDALRTADFRHGRATEALRSLDEPLLAAIVLGVVLVSLTWARQPLAALVLLALLFQRMVGRFRTVQSEYQSMAAAASALASLQERIATLEADAEPPARNSVALEQRPGLALEGVTASHRGVHVLRDVSLAVAPGDFVAIVGPSGAGKTTLLDLVAGLRAPDAGTVRIDGVPLTELSPDAWRLALGYVPQETALLHDTILANVRLGRADITTGDAAAALGDAGASTLLEALPQGLDTVVGERGGRLSGGERRRVALARALAVRPRVLLLDEATAELDVGSARAIGRTLAGLRGRMTILAVTHHQELAAHADAVYALERGRLVPVRRLTEVPT